MEEIEDKQQAHNTSDSNSEAEQRFENEGGAGSVRKPLCSPTKTVNMAQNAWQGSLTKFRMLKEHGLPAMSKLWKGSCSEYGALKKSFAVARVTYRKEKKKK